MPRTSGAGLRQRLSDRAPDHAQIVADVDPIRSGRPGTARHLRVERDRVDRCVAEPVGAGLPLAAAILARHRRAIDHGEQDLLGFCRHRQRSDRAALGEHCRYAAEASAAVVAGKQLALAEEIDPAGPAPRDDACRRCSLRSRDVGPVAVLESEHAARGSGEGALPVRREIQREHRAKDPAHGRRAPSSARRSTSAAGRCRCPSGHGWNRRDRPPP